MLSHSPEPISADTSTPRPHRNPTQYRTPSPNPHTTSHPLITLHHKPKPVSTRIPSNPPSINCQKRKKGGKKQQRVTLHDLLSTHFTHDPSSCKQYIWVRAVITHAHHALSPEAQERGGDGLTQYYSNLPSIDESNELGCAEYLSAMPQTPLPKPDSK